MGALLVVAFVGLVAARFGTRPAVAVLAGTVGVAAAAAKVAFDSIVQRDAPDAARGRTFARFETRFQLLWVLGAAVPVVITPLNRHIDLGMARPGVRGRVRRVLLRRRSQGGRAPGGRGACRRTAAAAEPPAAEPTAAEPT